MASIGWLHLTDLHLGLSGQKWLWPSVKEQFFKDLERLHAKSGPWDLVLFTGDLTQRGTKEEFDKLTETLGKLWEHFARLGSRPALVTVPGNHDLQRPKVTPTVRALRTWHTDADLRQEFWAGADNSYRTMVTEAFAAYEGFVKAHPLPTEFAVRQGVLPGDRSISLERDGLKLALVGLNTAFLQLESGDYQGKIDLDVRQLHKVCDEDPPEWLGAHHAALLLTHHPTTWLCPRALTGFKADVAPPGRFLAHLFGHMHEGGSTSLAVSGSSPQRAVQGPSLFGLETWGDGSEQRIHGYMAGRITLDGTQGIFKLWPRELRKNHAGAWQMTPDHSFALDEEAAVEEFTSRKTARSETTATMAVVSAAPPSDAGGNRNMSKLSGEQLQRLQDALLGAFPTRAYLAQMVRTGLDENLDTIAGGGGLRDTTFELITWAEAHGRTTELVVAACRRNPGSPALAQYSRAFVAATGTQKSSPERTLTQPSPRSSLRSLIGLVSAVQRRPHATALMTSLILVVAGALTYIKVHAPMAFARQQVERKVHYDLIVENKSGRQVVLNEVGVMTRRVEGDFQCMSGGWSIASIANYEVRFHVAHRETWQVMEPPLAIPPGEVVRFTVTVIPDATGACSRPWSVDASVAVREAGGHSIQTEFHRVSASDLRTALERLSPDDLARVIVGSRDTGSRAGALRRAVALSQGSPSLTRAVIAALDDPSSGVRQSACEASGALRIVESVPRLERMLETPHDSLDGDAARALGRIGSLAAITALERKLLRLTDSYGYLAGTVAQVLAQSESGAGVSSLLRCIRDATNPQVVGECCHWLVNSHASEAVGPIERRFQSESNEDIQWNLVAHLSRSGGPNAGLFGPMLINALRGTFPERVREEAVQQIGNYSSDSTVLDALETAILQDPAPRVRRRAIEVLSHIQNQQVNERLRRVFTSSTDPEIREVAALALSRHP